jgi:phosphatidylglycerophosphatase A
MTTMRKLIATFFGAGLSPIAPGTVGSLFASAVVYLLWSCFKPNIQIALVIGLVVACMAALSLGNWAIIHFKKLDPQPFVLDEVAGIFLTNLFLPMPPHWQPIYVIAVAFAAFRVFDIVKPPPVRQLELIPGRWGILLDDLAAAVYANLCCQLLLRLVV